MLPETSFRTPAFLRASSTNRPMAVAFRLLITAVLAGVERFPTLDLSMIGHGMCLDRWRGFQKLARDRLETEHTETDAVNQFGTPENSMLSCLGDPAPSGSAACGEPSRLENAPWPYSWRQYHPRARGRPRGSFEG